MKNNNLVLIILALITLTGCSKTTNDEGGKSSAANLAAVDIPTDAAPTDFLEALGTETGNGGGVVVCRSFTPGGTDKVELLDFYEARVLRNLKLDMGPDNLSFETKVENVLKKIAEVSPIRAAKYKKMYDVFFKEAVIIPDANLTYIDDAVNVVIPVGCTKEQASILRTPEFPEDPRYIISKLLWDKLDNNSKAGLILHEIIYQEAISLGQNNSKAVRYFVGKITATEAAAIDKTKFEALMTAVKFTALDKFGTLVKKTELSDLFAFEDDTSEFFADMAKPAEVKVGDLTLKPDFYIRFYKSNGLVEHAHWLKSMSRKSVRVQASSDLGFSASFSEQGKLTEISGVATGATADYEFSLRNQDYQNPNDIQIEFDENELPKFWKGIIHTKNNALNYDSGPMNGYRTEKDVRNITPTGILTRGTLEEAKVFPSPQGLLKFGGYNRSYQATQEDRRSHFTENGMLVRGNLEPGQEIRLADGRVKKYYKPLAIEFLANGLAKFLPVGKYGESTPDHQFDGCDIRDFSVVSKKILESGLLESGIRYYLKIEIAPKSLTVTQISDYVYMDYNDEVQALPTFEVNFKDTKNNIYSVKTMLSGSGISSGVSLNGFAYLDTDRTDDGKVQKFCRQHFVVGQYSYEAEFKVKNETTGYTYPTLAKISIGYISEAR